MKTNNYKEFAILKQQTRGDFVNVESDRLNLCMDYMTKESRKQAVFNSSLGYKFKNLDFLQHNQFIEGIFVVDDDIDISGIHYLKNLKTLIIPETAKQKIDFSCFPQLEICSINGKADIKNLETCKLLKKLHIRKYSPKEKDITAFSELHNLELLELIQSSITSLNGIEKLQNLKSVELHNINKLENITKLVELAGTLEKLIIKNCKKVVKPDEAIVQLKKLNWLMLSSYNEISSIKFINELSALKHFSFVGTTVKDGDLKPCIGLKYAGFMNKNHYSHTFEQIKRLNTPNQAILKKANKKNVLQKIAVF